MDGIHYTFLILILTIALFIWDKLRADFVALASMTALVLGGVLTAGDDQVLPMLACQYIA